MEGLRFRGRMGGRKREEEKDVHVAGREISEHEFLNGGGTSACSNPHIRDNRSRKRTVHTCV